MRQQMRQRPYVPGEPAPIVLTGGDLSVDDVVRVSRGFAQVSVSNEALHRVWEARQVVEQAIARGTPVYGLNTGLGSLARHSVALDDLERFSFLTVAEQAASYSDPLPTPVVRAMMLARANGMAKAGVGVRQELLLQVVDALNARVHPIVRPLGSVGQSDLLEMAEIGKVLIGRGFAEVEGRVMPGAEALAAVGLEPIRLAAKEALGLISANGLTMGHGSLVLADAADLLDTMQTAAALSLEGYAGNLSILHPAAARLRPHAGQITATERLRELLQESYLWQADAARNLQDPLSFRCVPQTHGAVYDVLAFVRGTMEVELNSAGDNPLVAVEDDEIISVGNFDVIALAMAFDLLRIALAEVIQMSNERVQKLLWGHFSGLPGGLSSEQGSSAGLRPMGRSCAALSAEARSFAAPVSLNGHAQLEEGIEDHASMAPLSVRRAAELVGLAHRVAALELIVSAQAVDMRGKQQGLGKGTSDAYEIVRECVPLLEQDATEWTPDVGRLVGLIAEGALEREVAADVGQRPALSGLEGPTLAEPTG